MAQISPASRFLEQWLKACEGKKNTTAMSQELYNSNLRSLQNALALQAADGPTRLTSKQQYLVDHFVLVPGLNREMKLAKLSRHEPGKIVYVVPNELLYETIAREHIAKKMGH